MNAGIEFLQVRIGGSHDTISQLTLLIEGSIFLVPGLQLQDKVNLHMSVEVSIRRTHLEATV